MISEKMNAAINEQINKELYSEYLYQAMAAWFASQGLPGFSNWMRVQAQEEHFHAMKFYDYVIETGGRVILEAIAKPPMAKATMMIGTSERIPVNVMFAACRLPRRSV